LPAPSDFAAGGLDVSGFVAEVSPGELGEPGDCANAAVASAALSAVEIINFLSIFASSRSQMIPEQQRAAMVGVPA
jgi:hypothetical protein